MTKLNTNNKSENMQAVFVSGPARSGTTLMQGLICNSEYTMENTRECSYFRAMIETYHLAAHSPFSMHASDYFKDKIELRDFHRQYLDLYFDHLNEKFGDGIPVQKEPRLLPMFPDVAELMENAVFICMIRDPRDLLVSQMRRFEKTGKKLNFQAWYEQQFPRLINMMKRKDAIGNRLLFVRYESLCMQPEKVLVDLNKKLSGLGYDLKLDQTVDDTSWNSKREKGEESASDLDGKPVSNSSVGSYKKVINAQIENELFKLQPILENITGLDWFCSDDQNKIEQLKAVA